MRKRLMGLRVTRDFSGDIPFWTIKLSNLNLKMQKRILQSLCIEPQYKGTLGMGIKYLTKSKQGNKSNALFCIFQAWHRMSNANNMAIWTDIRAFLTLFLTWSLIQSFNKQVALDWKRLLINRAHWFCIVLSSSDIQVWKKNIVFLWFILNTTFLSQKIGITAILSGKLMIYAFLDSF